MDKEGLELAARFAIPPNNKGMCGPNVVDYLVSFLSGTRVELPEVRRVLENGFPNMNLFLKIIADETGWEKFDKKTVEQYWLGGPVKIKKDNLLKKLESGSNKKLERIMKSMAPAEVPLTHMSRVVFGEENSADKTTGINLCMIAEGEVVELGEGRVKVRREMIKETEGKYWLASKEIATQWDRGINPDVRIGDKIATHWGSVVKVLNPEEADRLAKYNKIVAEMI